MGLDITAYSQLKAIGRHTTSWCDDEEHVVAFAYDSFPDSFRGIPVLGTETVSNGATFLVGGCYAITPATEVHGFRAGSYTGYNHWRADLARQFNAGPPHDPDLPFYELVWFADNEGCIGELAAAELLADFRFNADRYQPGEHSDWMREKYDDWHRAFELAAVGGLVSFH